MNVKAGVGNNVLHLSDMNKVLKTEVLL